jgi:hypothetical protein
MVPFTMGSGPKSPPIASIAILIIDYLYSPVTGLA